MTIPLLEISSKLFFCSRSWFSLYGGCSNIVKASTPRFFFEGRPPNDTKPRFYSREGDRDLLEKEPEVGDWRCWGRVWMTVSQTIQTPRHSAYYQSQGTTSNEKSETRNRAPKNPNVGVFRKKMKYLRMVIMDPSVSKKYKQK